MKFSMRTILALVTLVAVFLGAFFSRSELIISFAIMIGVAIILLSLALGITEANPVRRTFWIGFFVLSLGTLIVSSYLPTYNQLAEAIVLPMRRTGERTGELFPLPIVSPPYSVPSPNLPANFVQPPPTYYQPPAQSGLPPTFAPIATYVMNSGELYALNYQIHIMFALFSGLVGGTTTVWCFLSSKRMANHQEPGST
jgi:hypothetical protein